MTFDGMRLYSPVLRVNNRDENIAFYEKNLGFKLISEENALAFFSDWTGSGSQFVIEESPAYRTRAVEGKKKLNQIILKTSQPQDIAALLAQGAKASKLFKGSKGYAFETLSPENDRFLLHAEDDLSSLVEVDCFEGQVREGFTGLSDFIVDQISLNVADLKASQDFYRLFEGLPVHLLFVAAEGPDLAVEPHVTWDIEFIEFRVPADYDLASLKVYLEAQGQDVYLDHKEKVLAVSDPSRIEVWFSKE